MSNLNEAIQPKSPYELKGIITTLQDIYKNGIWKKYVNVEVSSTNQVPGRDPIYMIDRSHIGNETKDSWCANTTFHNPYVIVNFPKFYVLPSFYMLQSKANSFGVSTAWNVSILNDKKEWQTIATERNLFDTNVQGSTVSVPFRQMIPSKHFKFTSFENNHDDGDYGFCLRNIEIYGQVLFHYLPRIIQKNSFLSLSHTLIFIALT